MRKGTHHTAETRLAIRLNRLPQSMPPDTFAAFMDSDGTMKWCPTCKQLLSVEEFHRNKRAWDGFYDRCKACNAATAAAFHRKHMEDDEWRQRKNQRQIAYREANKGGEKLRRAYKAYNLKQNYGLTLAQFEALLAAQHNRCAICDRLFAELRDTHVDHDHGTGRVRGLLCNNCNNGLGRFRDDPAILRRAASYLEPEPS